MSLSAADRRHLREWISADPPHSAPVSASMPIPFPNAAPVVISVDVPTVPAHDEENHSEPPQVAALRFANSAPAPPVAPTPATLGIESAAHAAVPAAALQSRPTLMRGERSLSPAVQKHEVFTPETKDNAKSHAHFIFGAFVFLVLAALSLQLGRVAYWAARNSSISATSASTTHSSAPAAPFQVEVIDVRGSAGC